MTSYRWGKGETEAELSEKVARQRIIACDALGGLSDRWLLCRDWRMPVEEEES